MTKLIAAAIAIGLVAASGMAQSGLSAQIPFAFHVVDYRMPAGSYEIGAMNNGQVLRVANTSGKDTVLALFNPIMSRGRVPTAAAKLVFTRYGSEYFLSEVWRADEVTGREIPKTQVELELAKQYQPVRIESVIASRK